MNVQIFVDQAEALNEVAKIDCKVLVVANPANTNCLALYKHCPKLKRENFSALTRLDHNRALAQISFKEGVHFKEVSDAIVWGNHSSTQFPDARFAKVRGGQINQDHLPFYQDEFIKIVQQ